MRHPIWSCSARGFACHRRYRRRGALLPHLFTLTSVSQGGIFSVPLSVRLPCPGVTRRAALWSSDFPPTSALSVCTEARRPAIVWLTATAYYPSTSCLMPYCSSFL